MQLLRFNKIFQRCSLKFFVVIIIFAVGTYLMFSQFERNKDFPAEANINDEYIAEWDATDERLVKHIRNYYMIPPTSRNVPYKLLQPQKRYYSQKNQSMVVESLLGSRKNGFFLECGAYDGETYSNTLALEKYLNWTGVLIEPDKANFDLMKTKNRKSFLIRGCLESGNKPKRMEFYGAEDIGLLNTHSTVVRTLFSRLWKPMKYQRVWCFPLYSILLAVNRTTVDFFSLDVEGAEPAVLAAIPWDKIEMNLLMVEYRIFQGIFWDNDLSEKRKQELRSLVRHLLPDHKEITLVFHDMIFGKNIVHKP